MSKVSTIATRIREQRIAAGMTQRELAETIGLTIESLSRAERGTIVPKTQTLARIARALGTTLDQLAQGAPIVREARHAEWPELLRLRRHLDRLDRKTLRRLLGIVELLH